MNPLGVSTDSQHEAAKSVRSMTNLGAISSRDCGSYS